MKKTIISLLAFLLLLSACDYNFDYDEVKTEGSINPTIAAPLIDANFTLEELLPDDSEIDRYLIIDDNNFMTLVYKDSLAEVSISDFLQGIPPVGPTLPPISYSMNTMPLQLDLNINLNGGSITFFDPKLKFILTNNWDIPLEFKFKDMNYFPEPNSSPIPITGSFVTDTYTITRPTSTTEPAIQTLEMNVDNSNINEVLSALPDHLTAGAEISTIPGEAYDLTNVKNDKVNMEIEIPLNLSINNILFTDTLDFDLDVNSDSTKVKTITMNFVADNGFPIGMNTQIYFLDENFTIVDSVFNGRINLAAASVSNGIANTNTETKVSVTIPENRIDNILDAKYMMPHIKLSTTDAANLTPVMIFSTYGLGIKLSAMAELELIL